MANDPTREQPAYLYCSRETREAVRDLKRGGETFDTLLWRMVEHYDPDAADNQEDADGGV